MSEPDLPYYKLWVEVERVREGEDGEDDEVYENLDSPFGSAATFTDEDEAQEFAELMQCMAEAAFCNWKRLRKMDRAVLEKVIENLSTKDV